MPDYAAASVTLPAYTQIRPASHIEGRADLRLAFAEPLDSAADVELHEQVKRDNQRDPQQSDDNRPAIQVLLSDTGGACILRQTTAEHIGQAAPLTLVHEDKQRQQEAEDDKKNLDNQLKNSQT